MNSLSPKTFEAALEKTRNRPVKARSPLARGKGFSRPSSPLRRKSAKSAPITAKVKKGKKKITTGRLKKRVWKEFSIFIRTRGADENGFNRCVTCIVKKHWKELQAGHFIRGRLNSNLFDERGVNPQCYICNVHFQGNVVVYYGWMLAKHGQEVIDELIAQNNQTKKWAANELQGLLDHYRAINKANALTRDLG
jgi:hypothetical protein